MDTATLMKPLRVVSIPPQSDEIASFVDLSAHALLMPTHLLSDMIVLFQSGQEEAKQVPFDASIQVLQDLGRGKSYLGTIMFYVS